MDIDSQFGKTQDGFSFSGSIDCSKSFAKSIRAGKKNDRSTQHDYYYHDDFEDDVVISNKCCSCGSPVTSSTKKSNNIVTSNYSAASSSNIISLEHNTIITTTNARPTINDSTNSTNLTAPNTSSSQNTIKVKNRAASSTPGEEFGIQKELFNTLKNNLPHTICTTEQADSSRIMLVVPNGKSHRENFAKNHVGLGGKSGNHPIPPPCPHEIIMPIGSTTSTTFGSPQKLKRPPNFLKVAKKKSSNCSPNIGKKTAALNNEYQY